MLAIVASFIRANRATNEMERGRNVTQVRFPPPHFWLNHAGFADPVGNDCKSVILHRGGGHARDHTIFVPPDNLVVASLPAVSTWANSYGRYGQGAIADSSGRLVSHAHAYGLTVVTHEISSTSPNKIQIPDACGLTARS